MFSLQYNIVFIKIKIQNVKYIDSTKQNKKNHFIFRQSFHLSLISDDKTRRLSAYSKGEGGVANFQ